MHFGTSPNSFVVGTIQSRRLITFNKLIDGQLKYYYVLRLLHTQLYFSSNDGRRYFSRYEDISHDNRTFES